MRGKPPFNFIADHEKFKPGNRERQSKGGGKEKQDEEDDDMEEAEEQREMEDEFELGGTNAEDQAGKDFRQLREERRERVNIQKGR